MTAHLRDRITGDLHLGHVHAGDRLPGVREVAAELGVGVRAAVRAYRELAEEGLVEVRSRSGVYVAPQERLHGEVLEETADWLTEMLTGALTRRITIPELPEFVRRCTAAFRPRCALLESTDDHLTVLTAELTEEFGFHVQPVKLPSTPGDGRLSATQAQELSRSLSTADLILTTVYHASLARQIAAIVDRSLVVVTIRSNIASALERHLRSGTLTVVCADPAFGERVQSIHGGRYSGLIRVVLARDTEAVHRLDPAEPVLLTLAARRLLGRTPLRNIVPHLPTLSRESARELAAMLVRLNLQAARAAEGG